MKSFVFGTEFWVLSVIWKYFSFCNQRSPGYVTVVFDDCWRATWVMCCPGTPAAYSFPPHAQTTIPATVPQHGEAGELSSHPLLMLLTVLDTWYFPLHSLFTAEVWRTTADPMISFHSLLYLSKSNPSKEAVKFICKWGAYPSMYWRSPQKSMSRKDKKIASIWPTRYAVALSAHNELCSESKTRSQIYVNPIG